MRARPGFFLDRDGVIVEEVGHLSDPAQLSLIPGSAEAIADINRNGIPVIVVTNQAGVARGYYPKSRVAEIHDRLSDLLAVHGAHIDRYYYCPHHPTEGSSPYLASCDCRKPRPGMLLRAAAELSVDLSRSYMVGDKLTDLEAGLNAGCHAILVKTGYGYAFFLQSKDKISDRTYVAEDLLAAVKLCLPNLVSRTGASGIGNRGSR